MEVPRTASACTRTSRPRRGVSPNESSADPRVVQVLPRVRERRRQGLLSEKVGATAAGTLSVCRGAATVDALLRARAAP